ncbi:MAG: DUF2764 family protein [Deltaproteobacteria bacterium]|nr:DUF2764 family protein [Deltaproteobacteria bacterium]MBN2672627.1 DUF2764 family protein [Deltaproteobacteria bacterium]
MGYEELFPLFPQLKWEMAECPEPEDFFEEARIWIPDDQVQWLEMIFRGKLNKINLHECEIVADLVEFDTQVKAELQLLRQNKSGTTILPSGFIKENNPLEREEKLLRLRWEFIEEQKAPEDDWGLRAVFMYMLQLTILIRRSSFIREDGAVKFAQLCNVSSEKAA